MTLIPINRDTDTDAAATAAAEVPPTKRWNTETRRSRDIIRLLEQHSELRGVHAMADLLDDAVRWTA